MTNHKPHADLLRRYLQDGDVGGVRRLWRHLSPYLPLPNEGFDSLVAMHLARTMMPSIRFKERAYSHAWLRDHGMPSGLPDNLRPKAERKYPPSTEAVAIATKTPIIGPAVRRVMEAVVMDHYSTDREKRPDPVVVKRDMLRQRAEFRRRFVDTVTSGWRK